MFPEYCHTLHCRPLSSPISTPFQLNVNLDLDLEPGVASRVRVPQGELMLMFLPRIRGPGGGEGSVELRSVSRDYMS